ncbi:MAG: hypothetical protein ACKVI8_06210 [Paraglaciecola sp.]
MKTHNPIKMINGDFCIKAKVLGLASSSNIISEIELDDESPLVLIIPNVITRYPSSETAHILTGIRESKLIQFRSKDHFVDKSYSLNLWFSHEDEENLSIFYRASLSCNEDTDATIYCKEFDITLCCTLRRVPHPEKRLITNNKVNKTGKVDTTDSLVSQLRSIGF